MLALLLPYVELPDLHLFGLTIHIGWQVTYKNGDVPNDMLVYVQSSPDVPFVMKQLEYLSNVLGQGKEMTLMLDNGYTDTAGGSTVVHESIAWPFEWYLRDWKTKRWFSKTLPTDATPDRTPVILVAPQTRLWVRRLIESVLPQVAVLAFNEIVRGTDIESRGMVVLSHESQNV